MIQANCIIDYTVRYHELQSIPQLFLQFLVNYGQGHQHTRNDTTKVVIMCNDSRTRLGAAFCQNLSSVTANDFLTQIKLFKLASDAILYKMFLS